jgi:dihydroflavonol-4-reductase
MVTTAVTGVTGMIGRAVADRLVAAGHHVRGIVRPSSNVAGLPFDVATTAFDDPSALCEALSGCEFVVHCAALYAYGDDRRAELESVNVEGTRKVVEAAKAAGVRRVVVTSSSVTAGSSADGSIRTEAHRMDGGHTPYYYTSKARQERAAFLAAGDAVDVVICCPTVVMGGPAARLIPSNAIILRYLLDWTRSTFPGGCNVVSLGDVAEAHLLLAERGVPGHRYLIGGENLSWRSLHSLIADLAGVAGPRVELPSASAYFVSAAAELWSRFAETEPLSTRDEALTIGRYYWYSHDKAGAIGYSPAPARHAIAQGLAWLLCSPHLPRWVRDGLRPMPEVRASRVLVPRAL